MAENKFDGAQFCRSCGAALNEQAPGNIPSNIVENEQELDFQVTETTDSDAPQLFGASSGAKQSDIVSEDRLEIKDNANLLESGIARDIDVVLACDMFYERHQAQATQELLRMAVRTGRLVLIADGQRAFAPDAGIRPLHQAVIAVNQDLEGTPDRLVRILQLLGG